MAFAFLVYHQSADSYNSVPELPVAVFTDEAMAQEFAAAQPGYGVGIDWFVRAVPMNPPNKLND